MAVLHVGIGTQARHEHNDGTCGDSNVDFVYVYGNLPPSGAIKTLEAALDNKVAYAHTYVHSPAGGEFHLRVNYAGAALKVLLNGQVVAIPRSRTAEVSLKKGWNRLLLKVASDKAAVPRGQNPWVSRWRVAAYIEPALPVCYETKNVAWMTPMTGRSMSQPILVGDRIYVGSGMTDLLCIDRETGRIAWLRTNTPYDAMTDEQHQHAGDPGQGRPAGGQAGGAERRGGQGDQRGRVGDGPALGPAGGAGQAAQGQGRCREGRA